MESGKHLNSSATEKLAKSQGDWKPLSTDIVPSKVWWDYMLNGLCNIETGPRSIIQLAVNNPIVRKIRRQYTESVN